MSMSKTQVGIDRENLMNQYGLHYPNPRKSLPSNLIIQIQQCKSEEARRLLLGISQKEDSGR